ncbi:hypothetical protein DSO57_1014735 [Entomophthora muscae]|uniref:Uncharacterized protein n=1 Tax=Entomophthora muscae TaxID=34485 RepID=A0ACC2U3L5_9FUNG|nr:hypothetical protein DSO57_1014735 [Entomophthora muscae]
MSGGLPLALRGKEFSGKDFMPLFQELYIFPEGLTQTDVVVHGTDSRMLVKKVLKEFSGLYFRYKVLKVEHCHLKNGAPTHKVSDNDPGQPMMTSLEKEHHKALFQDTKSTGGLQ